MRVRMILPVIGLFLVLGARGALASEPLPLGGDTLKVSAGGFLADMNSKFDFTVATKNQSNGSVDLEDRLGLSKSKGTYRVDGYWRFFPRHRLSVGFYEVTRAGSNVIDREFEWQDAVYQVNGTVDTRFSWRVIPVSYSYSFYKSGDLELAASVGVHFLRMSATVTGDAMVNGSLVQGHTESTKTDGPFPLVGLLADYQFAPGVIGGVSVQWLSLSVGDYSGSLTDAKAYIEYYFTRNVGVGLAYNYFDFSGKVRNEPWTAALSNSYGGVLFYVSAKL